MDNIQRYKYRTRRGSSALSSETFYTGAVRNERILQKKETYKELVKTLGGKRADYSAVFIGFAEVVRRVCGRGNCVQVEGFGTFRNVCRGGFETSKGPWVKGRNFIEIACTELAEFKNALIDAVGANVFEGENLVFGEGDSLTFHEIDLPDTEITCDVTSSSPGKLEFVMNGSAPSSTPITFTLKTRGGIPGGPLQTVEVEAVSRDYEE